MRTDRVGNRLPIWLVLMLAGPASAATVTFEMVPVGGSAGDEVVVAPGTEVAYELTATVTSDDSASSDNDGLAFFSVTVETDLGVTQIPADEFDSVIAQAFPFVQSLGRADDDDILEIGGGQNTFSPGSATTGLGVGQAQLLARGRLITPTSEGTFTITPTASANVFDPGSDTSVSVADSVVATGFTIRTQEGAGTDPEPGPPSPPLCGSGTASMAAGSLLLLALLRFANLGRAARRDRC